MTERATGGAISGPGIATSDSIPFQMGGCWHGVWMVVGPSTAAPWRPVTASDFEAYSRGEVYVTPHWFLTFERYGKRFRWNRHPGMAPRVSVPVKPSTRTRRRKR